MVKGVDKYKGKGVFKANERSKYKVEGYTNFVNLFRDKNQRKLYWFTTTKLQ